MAWNANAGIRLCLPVLTGLVHVAAVVDDGAAAVVGGEVVVVDDDDVAARSFRSLKWLQTENVLKVKKNIFYFFAELDRNGGRKFRGNEQEIFLKYGKL